NQENQQTFFWRIPYAKLEERGLGLHDIVTVQVIGEDTFFRDTDTFSGVIEVCEDHTNTCYELESVILHYYNEDFNEIREFEIAKELLPYEFDNGEGTMVTVGWNNILKAPTIMITGGYHEGNHAFVLHAVGIRYLDYDGESQIKWGYNVSDSSEGINNPELIPGDPDNKNTDWLADIQNGDYSTAPSLNKINDWVTISFDNDWVVNHCPLEEHFDPEEHKQPEEPPAGEE